jgi:hypothetical protein
MDKQDTETLVKSLKKIEGYLEAIDWKLWTFHQKYIESVTPHQPKTAEQEENNQLSSILDDRSQPDSKKIKKPTWR